MSDDTYRVTFRVTAFSSSQHLSPERIEKRMLDAVSRIVLDPHEQLKENEVFGYVSDMSVEKVK